MTASSLTQLFAKSIAANNVLVAMHRAQQPVGPLDLLSTDVNMVTCTAITSVVSISQAATILLIFERWGVNVDVKSSQATGMPPCTMSLGSPRRAGTRDTDDTDAKEADLYCADDDGSLSSEIKQGLTKEVRAGRESGQPSIRIGEYD
jgi:hypothetical protein